MKKLVLAAAVATLSATAAHAAPTVYGKAFLSLDYTDTDGANSDRVKMNDNSSRIGVKGSEAISSNTKVVYKLEYGLDVENNSGDFGADPRDSYIGLADNAAGTVLFGRLTAVDDLINYANVGQGMYDGILASIDGPRANNAIAYLTPEMSGLQAGLMYVMDENSSEDSLGRDAAGFMVKYASDAFNAGASYITAGDNLKYTRLSGNFALMPNFTVGALYQMIDFNTNDDENTVTLSAEYGMGATTVYGQYDNLTDGGGASGADSQRFVLGAKQKLAKQTTLHGYVGYTDPDGDDNNTLGLGVGVEKKF